MTFDREFKNMAFNALAGYSYQQYWQKGNGFARADFPSDLIPLVNNIQAGTQDVNAFSFSEKNGLQSLFARINLAFKEKYLLTVNFRRDGSTRFGANNKYGNFPSIAVGWRLSQEGFLRGVHMLDDLKLRFSWGLTGNQEVPNKIAQPLFGATFFNQAILDESNKPTIGYAFIRTPNPDLKWEDTRQINFGFDFSLFNGRFHGAVDYFDKVTRDFLLFIPAVSVPSFSPNIWTNLDGQIRNYGLELTLESRVIQRTSFRWQTGLTLTSIDNNVTGVPTPISVGIPRGLILPSGNRQFIINNQPLGTFYGLRWLGFDANGFNIYEQDDEGNLLETVIGSALPDFTWGWTNSFQLDRFDLHFLVNGSHGNEVLNQNFLSQIPIQRFPFGINTTSDLLYSGENLNNAIAYSSRFIYDGSFVRLSQLTLGYNWNVDQVDWLGSLRLYLTGSNLLLITKYPGYDPEVNIPIEDSNNSIPNIGIDWDAIPRPISIQFGLKASLQ